MCADQGPVIHRALLSSELVRLRQEKNLKQETVARALDWSPSKLIRIEGGSVGISTTDLQALLRQYGVDDGSPLMAHLIELARGARERGWWSSYSRELSSDPAYLAFLGYEYGASRIKHFGLAVMPALLQTEDYARALTRQYVSEERAEMLVTVRMLRQEKLLERDPPPEQAFVLDEAVIRRRVGRRVDLKIMPNQLKHLLELQATRPYLTIQVIPFDVGAHFGMTGNFAVLEFEGALGPVLYLENSRGGALTVTGRDPEIVNYNSAFETLRETALSPEASRELIERVIAEMG